MTNHKRNTMKRFLSTFVLLFIVAAGFCKDPKYIFYFIGDGMGPSHVLGTELYLGEVEGTIGRPHKLCFTQFPQTAFVTTFSASNGVTDSAASGTALATGEKTNNGYIGKDAEGNDLDFETALPVIAEGCRRVAEFAAGLGIKTMTENHGKFMQDALRVKKLIETVNHPNFGWLVDMGNFMGVDEVCVESVKIAAPYAVHAHAKDVHRKTGSEFKPLQGWGVTRGGNYLRGAIIGHGDVNVPECLRILRDAGYDGWLSVEFEGIEDCFLGIRAGIENLRSITADLGI